jgi:hypothetical protein
MKCLFIVTALSLFKSLLPHQKCSVLPDASKKIIMIWALALARVSFSAAKIVSCNNKKYFHGLPSKLLQLFYFMQIRSTTNGKIRREIQNPNKFRNRP